ncbi:restriction endonuclease subunit S [Roseibium sp.]|uniref:restriction endonuclease subunit S n=1 Tax=Roseibium sp. TaxID=1936156 RepID=UPI00391A4A83
MNWKETDLEDFVDLISGPAFKSSKFTNDTSDFPLIKGENIGQGEIIWSKSKYWPASDSENYEKYFLEAGDVILAMDRPWVTAGLKFAIMRENNPKSLLVQRVARMRGKNGLRSDYLGHLVSSKPFSAYIQGIMGGTNVPHISGKQIKSFRFQLPPLEAQEKIASILSAYDYLIDNNKRRIALLEDAARQLYKEWFVRFRFPGHEHVKIVDGVPEGWERLPLGELLTLQRGFDLPVKDRKEGSVPIYASTGINGFHNEAKAKGPGLVTGRSGSLGKVILVLENFWPLNTALWVKEFKKIDPYFSYFLLQSLRLENYNGGAAVPTLNRNDVHRIDVSLPSAALLTEFADAVSPTFEQQRLLKRQNEKLGEARDLLLQKLMSGEIPV